MNEKVSIRSAQHMEGYLRPETREKRIKGALAVIKYRDRHGDTFDSIAYRGASGAITASIIAHQLKKPLILVRKPEDNKGHSPYMIEGPTKVRRYLIIDDFMSSGSTYEAIREAVRKEHPQAICIGMLEVTYCENGGCEKEYRFSREHAAEIDRDIRIKAGKATQEDVKWITREKPLPPNVIYQPVNIWKNGDKYSFGFEWNTQKLLVADTAPKRTLSEIIDDWNRAFVSILGPRPKPVPEVDRVDVYRTSDLSTPLMMFTNPISYQVQMATSDFIQNLGTYDQKTQAAPEAGVSAATAG